MIPTKIYYFFYIAMKLTIAEAKEKKVLYKQKKWKDFRFWQITRNLWLNNICAEFSYFSFVKKFNT
jgi:hypothetical protein